MSRIQPELYQLQPPADSEIPKPFLRALTEGLLLTLREAQILTPEQADRALDHIP